VRVGTWSRRPVEGASYESERSRGVPVERASYESERSRGVPLSEPRTSQNAVEVSRPLFWLVSFVGRVLFFLIVDCGYPWF
jgi:hypothetical protein